MASELPQHRSTIPVRSAWRASALWACPVLVYADMMSLAMLVCNAQLLSATHR